EVMLVLNASPFHIGKYDERLAMLRQRSRENSVPILYLNTVGGQDELVFDGESLVIDENGELISRAPAFESSIDYVDVNATQVSTVVKRDLSTLREDEAIYKALVLGVKDFVHKNGFTGVVIGLSGGVDSALTLAIAVDALGAEHVHTVMMPSQYTAGMSRDDAEAEAVKLGVKYDIIPIESVFTSFLGLLEDAFEGKEADATEENIQARCRGLILMAISNKTGRMVLTTGNKSEMAVGYTTLYGDMSGGFAPLKDVSKTRVYQLCRYRNTLSDVIPERVLTRPPSAELRPDQCDQDSLPDYDVLDRILELSVEQDMPMDEIIATGLDREVVEQVITMVQRNEYKRRQAAPGVRITRRAFGRDRRYPITSGYRRS
ncbi:MAG: NAD+ synthase, partial [Gammaproteobacteria bacterium]